MEEAWLFPGRTFIYANPKGGLFSSLELSGKLRNLKYQWIFNVIEPELVQVELSNVGPSVLHLPFRLAIIFIK
jgi:hypothetical protein